MSSYLPEDILQEIFLRLPGRSLLPFRCVSKSFRTLIDAPSIHSMHHELNNINTSIMICNTLRKEIYTIDYKSILSLLPLSTSSTTMCEFINHMNYPSMFEDYQHRVDFFSSCNGLVWLSLTTSMRGKELYYIWNPSTEVYKNIPMPREVNYRDICHGYGFNYDYKTDDYKLARVVFDWDSKCFVVDVYTLSSNSWKSPQSIPYHIYDEISWSMLFNGALYWLARSFGKHSTVLVVCFDIVNERFEEVAMPEAPEEPLEDDKFDIDVGVLGGCLCLIFRVHSIRVDVWTMQEYGVRESWTKSFSITQECITNSTYLELIWSFKNNEILWEVDQGLVLYDPNTKIYRELTLDSAYYERLTVAQDYVATSVPP